MSLFFSPNSGVFFVSHFEGGRFVGGTWGGKGNRNVIPPQRFGCAGGCLSIKNRKKQQETTNTCGCFQK